MAESRIRKRKKTPRLVDSVAQRKRSTATRVVGWLFFLGLVGLVCGAAVVSGLFLYYGSDPDLPSIKNIGDYHPKVVSRVLDRDGESLGEIYEERRTVVARARIPEAMIHAIVDAEDAQFFEHKGLNYWGMLRAALNNLRPGAHLQGASTLTQQLVKTYVLGTNERTVKRKVQEAILARRLEAALSKDEILTMYLNQIYFGHQRYGVEEAARFFFGKSISDVNPGEAALLASLPKGPEEISPLKHPERAKARQRYVLDQMLRYAHVTKAEYDRYYNAPIAVVKQPASAGAAPEFVDEARKALLAKFGEKRLPYLGTTVKTTCDTRIERLAREALERGLETLDERQGYRKPVAHLKVVTAAAIKQLLSERALHKLHALIKSPSRSQRGKWLDDREKALGAGKTVEAVVVEVRPSAGVHPGVIVDAAPLRGFLPAQVVEGRHDRYNPKGLVVEKRFAVGDVITVRAEPSLGFVELGQAPEKTPEKTEKAVKPEAEKPVVAPQQLPAKEAKKGDRGKGKQQPPVVEKPAVAAADDGDEEAGDGSHKGLPVLVPEFGPQGAVVVIDPATREVKAAIGGYGFRAGGFDRAIQAKRQPGSSFKPFLYATAFLSGKYTPASILNDSPQIFEQPGLEDWKPKNAESHDFLGPVRLRTALAKSLNTVAAQLIFDLKPESVAATAKACGLTSPLDHNLALGLGASVVSLIELTNAYATFDTLGKHADPMLLSELAEEPQPREEPQQALQPEVAYLVTSMLQSVIEEGTAQSARGKLKRPAAGKTGTTSSERDAWFIGFTPDVVVGVWIGFDDMRDLGHGEQGARSALPIWVDVMAGTLKGVPPSPFSQPAAVEVRKIDPATGLLAQPNATNAIEEVFLPGSAPTQMAPQAGEQNPDTFIMQ